MVIYRMKSIQFYEYGSPDVFRYEEVAPPETKPGHLLVDVHAAGLNPVDWRYRKGQLKWYDWFSSFPRTPGSDLAGTVEDIGRNVEGFETGDRIFAMLNPLGSGTYSEKVLVPASNAVRIPENTSFVEAAGLPLVSLTSIQALRDKASLSQDDEIIINGASGGVGTVGVQLARIYGATVTGVCSHRNTEFVKDLGAERVIDYTENDFAEITSDIDVVYDAYGNRTLNKVRDCLRSDGRYVTTDIGPLSWFDSLRSRILPGPTCSVIVVSPEGDDLKELANYVSEGRLRSVVDETYALENADEAHRYSETRRATGKIILTMK